ncbi:(deoxy)nucleoside triphosphate pyrophosphohydrolase [Clostridium felsineum]|uniref:8-oxo-dGTP diphosphatase n=1 Tax=Clostridium felsineum TaxID=36839 RepID=A0A1S8KX84_9CLOT|nr:(deoxy)nucleoside triphosphate pyrophosphohydrolase [Clostridium felsineum]MCR3758424.1 (deoxy)nucleoside triphosphate pyrophosphohydrolase [Clostridium felsineum]URZ07909.1 CTP pyrophosphohydrolase [Clostridium felsineum]URZ12940.1 CTP pyrophosphohydrolase [Clostridium felsineum]
MLDIVAAILTNENDEILITKIAEGKNNGGCFEFPGGKIENGETRREALAREVKEELDIDIKVGEYFGESVYNDGGLGIKLNAFKGEIVSGDIKLSVHDEYKWVKKDELKDFKFLPADEKIVEELIAN